MMLLVKSCCRVPPLRRRTSSRAARFRINRIRWSTARGRSARGGVVGGRSGHGGRKDAFVLCNGHWRPRDVDTNHASRWWWWRWGSWRYFAFKLNDFEGPCIPTRLALVSWAWYTLHGGILWAFRSDCVATPCPLSKAGGCTCDCVPGLIACLVVHMCV